MIEVGVVDLSAEGRRRLGSLLERWSWVSPDARNASLPRLSLHLLSPEEVRFHGSIDVCLVGPELVGCDAAFLSKLRQQLPGKILICVLDTKTYSFGMIEQLGRLEVDDILMDSASGDEFFRRLILLTKKVARKRIGELLVVDAARGGVGSTFVTAGLAESSFLRGKSVCVVDTDVVSQDLTRFLGCKPFVNEPLKVILDQQRVITGDTVKECLFEVWDGEAKWMCMPPAASSDQGFFSQGVVARSFTGVLDVARTFFDVVIVDAAPLVASMRQALYQVASTIHFVVNRDPAGAYANRQAVSIVSGCIHPDAQLSIVVNDIGKFRLSVSALKEQVLLAGDVDMKLTSLPYSGRAARWACSGATPAQFLRRQFSQLSEPRRIANSVAMSEVQECPGVATSPTDSVMGRILGALRRTGPSREKEILSDKIAREVSRNSSAASLLSILPENPTASDLVSKPTVAGH
jgi:Mrp family chromosome partitioning ATPase